MKAEYSPYELIFKRPSGTSRGILHKKLTYLLKLYDKNSGKYFIGECPFFKGLSADNEDKYTYQLQWVCDNINKGFSFLYDECQYFPSLQFGLEQIFKLFENQEENLFFPSEFTNGNKGITINGLIWMGNVDFMREQIQQKLENAFSCIKLKIGVNWEEEHKVIKQLREQFDENQLEIRVDANGAFSSSEAKKVLNQLNKLKIHSIEQPIKAGQEKEMAELCASTPTPIALDEELIGKFLYTQKEETIIKIKPQYIILKPALVGGWKASSEWIELAEKNNAAWWVTSALESNIGLNAIAQWTETLNNPMPQGLGTGTLYVNNFPSHLKIIGEKLFYKPDLNK